MRPVSLLLRRLLLRQRLRRLLLRLGAGLVAVRRLLAGAGQAVTVQGTSHYLLR